MFNEVKTLYKQARLRVVGFLVVETFELQEKSDERIDDVDIKILKFLSTPSLVA